MDHPPPVTPSSMPPVRWDRKKGIYPTSLRRYLECPLRCRLEYIDRVRIEPTWERTREVGNALHKVMERVGNTRKARIGLPPMAGQRALVERLLPPERYADPQVRAGDIDDVLAWADAATRYLADARVLIVEHYDPREVNAHGDLGHVKLGAKADVVLLRGDAEGPYVEILDYKTGHGRDHTRFTPLLSRIALHRHISREMGGVTEPRVVFTYFWLCDGEVDVREMPRARLDAEWSDLCGILTRMLEEEAWPMRPDPTVCRFCPYRDVACHPFPQPAESDPRGGATG